MYYTDVQVWYIVCSTHWV